MGLKFECLLVRLKAFENGAALTGAEHCIDATKTLGANNGHRIKPHCRSNTSEVMASVERDDDEAFLGTM